MDTSTFQLEVTFEPANATDKRVSYVSSDEAIATVDASGLITAVAVGECTITVKSLENESITATCDITVEEAIVALSGISLNATAKTLVIQPTRMTVE